MWALFVLYALFVSSYFLALPRPMPVPDVWLGTPADPATFIPPDELRENALFARIRDILYFLESPLKWFLLLTGLFSGWFSRLRERLGQRFKSPFLSGLAFIVFVLLLLELMHFPFAVSHYVLSRYAGVSNMDVGFWLTDQLKSFVVSTVLIVPVLLLLFLLIRNSPKRWWLWMGACAVPLILFYSFARPVILDPLFNDYRLLGESELKQRILALAEQADIPADKVYEVDMSRRTNALNAYVTGIGSNARIVLWDTTLKQLEEDEILFTMAHEMGHYKLKHVWWGMWLSLGGTFISLYVLYRISRWLVRRFGWAWGIDSLSRVAVLPVFVLVFSVISFVSTPAGHVFSRTIEKAADEYALAMVGSPEAGITGFQQLARQSRSETYPPAFIRFWRYTHPSISERLHRFAAYDDRSGELNEKINHE